MDLAAFAQYGGFGVLAAAAIGALWKFAEFSMKQLGEAHARETESLRAALTYISASQATVLDVARESTAAVSSLSDEVATLSSLVRGGGRKE